jgi:hypothetical protein
MRKVEEKEQRYREARHITAGISDQEQHHNDDVHAPAPPTPLKHAHNIHHSVQICVRYVDNIVTLCHLRHPSGCSADCT